MRRSLAHILRLTTPSHAALCGGSATVRRRWGQKSNGGAFKRVLNAFLTQAIEKEGVL